jgi:CheY-like chemotaxis protein
MRGDCYASSTACWTSLRSSRAQRACVEATDVAALTTDIVSPFRAAVEAAGLRLRLELSPHLPPVPLDREMWEKVVSHLISNALKFTFDGEIAVRLHSLRMHVELEVTDTGVGIPRDELPNIFKRFHRVPGTRARTAEGSGIGLSIVQDLVHRMGGQITVHSIEGRGTRFTVWLPLKSRLQPLPSGHITRTTGSSLAADLAAEALRWMTKHASSPPADVLEDALGLPAAQPGATGAAKGRLLVVDDNADIRQYLHRLLSGNWHVDLATCAREALDVARRQPPDVMLADVMLPGMDGFQLLRQLRSDSTLAHAPVILLTARAGEEAAISGLRCGADDYIAKPFSPRELVARVQAASDRFRADRALRQREALLAAQGKALEAALDDVPLASSLSLLVGAAVDRYGPSMRCAFYLANADGTALHHVVGMTPAYAKAVDGFAIGAQSLACGLAAHRGEPVLTADVMEDPDWKSWRSMAVQFGYRGCWSFPIRTSAGRYVGSFAVYSREPREATPADVDFASHVTRVAAIIISRHDLSRGR